MKEHQVKINEKQLNHLASSAAYDLYNELTCNNPNYSEIDDALDRVNYLVKRYSKAISGKPEIETQQPEPTIETNEAPAAASGWGN